MVLLSDMLRDESLKHAMPKLGDLGINEEINKTYQYRTYLHETYDKAEMLGDLTGRLLNIRMSSKLEGISVDVTGNCVIIEDKDDKKRKKAMKEINDELKEFAKKFSYLSSLPDTESDDFEKYLNTRQLYDTVEIGDQVKILL